MIKYIISIALTVALFHWMFHSMWNAFWSYFLVGILIGEFAMWRAKQQQGTRPYWLSVLGAYILWPGLISEVITGLLKWRKP